MKKLLLILALSYPTVAIHAKVTARPTGNIGIILTKNGILKLVKVMRAKNSDPIVENIKDLYSSILKYVSRTNKNDTIVPIYRMTAAQILFGHEPKSSIERPCSIETINSKATTIPRITFTLAENSDILINGVRTETYSDKITKNLKQLYHSASGYVSRLNKVDATNLSTRISYTQPKTITKTIVEKVDSLPPLQLWKKISIGCGVAACAAYATYKAVKYYQDKKEIKNKVIV